MSVDTANECPKEIVEALEDMNFELAELQHLILSIAASAEALNELPQVSANEEIH